MYSSNLKSVRFPSHIVVFNRRYPTLNNTLDLGILLFWW